MYETDETYEVNASWLNGLHIGSLMVPPRGVGWWTILMVQHKKNRQVRVRMSVKGITKGVLVRDVVLKPNDRVKVRDGV